MIQSVDRAIRMLLELQGARNLALSELAALMELSPSTTHGLLKTLVARDLVRQDPQTQRYHLGPAVLRLAGVYLDALDLRTRALPWVRDLVTKTGLQVRIGVRSGSEVILVHHEAAPNQHSHMAELGIGLPAHSSSLGKAILAFEPDDALDMWTEGMPAMTSSTVTSLKDFRDELETIRSEGVAFEREESVIGESTVGAPIFGPGNRVIGSIAVVLDSSEDTRLQEVVNPTLDIALAISRELGANLTGNQLPQR